MGGRFGKYGDAKRKAQIREEAEAAESTGVKPQNKVL